MSVRHFLFILKKSLTKTKESSIRAVPAMYSITVLPFGQTEASCADHWRTFAGWSPLWGSNWTPTCARTKCRNEQGARCKPSSSVTQVTALPASFTELKRGQLPREWWGESGGQRLVPGTLHNGMWMHRSFMELSWQRLGSCAHIPLPLVSRACLYFFLMSYKSNLQYQFFAHSQSRVIQRAAASSFTSYWPTPNHFFIPICKKCFSQELQAQTCWLKLLQMWFTLVFTQWFLQKSCAS